MKEVSGQRYDDYLTRFVFLWRNVTFKLCSTFCLWSTAQRNYPSKTKISNMLIAIDALAKTLHNGFIQFSYKKTLYLWRIKRLHAFKLRKNSVQMSSTQHHLEKFIQTFNL